LLPDRAIPNATLRVLLDSIEEVMGKSGIKAILKAARLEKYIDNPPPKTMDMEATASEYAALQQSVEDFYGRRGARAILLRIGRSTFQYALRDQPAILGLSGVLLKTLPEKTRMKFVLQKMAKTSTEQLNQRALLKEEKDAFYFIMDVCPCQWRPKHEYPCGFVAVGSFMEAMAWATGRVYRVEEVACISCGASNGVFRIPKTPD